MKSLALTVLAVVALTLLTACGGAPDQPEPNLGGLVEIPINGPVVPIPFGQPGCTKKGPGFQPPPAAVTCDVYNGVEEFLGQIKVKDGTYYCSMPAGYVRCTDAQGRHMRPDETRAMCGFEGEEPSCPDFGEITDPRVVIDPSKMVTPPSECPPPNNNPPMLWMLAPMPPDPT